MDGGAWWATVHRVAELDMIERIHFHFCHKRVHFWAGSRPVGRGVRLCPKVVPSLSFKFMVMMM